MISADEAIAEVYWTAFQALPKREREAIINRFLESSQLMEDVMDLSIIKERRNESSRSLKAYISERKRKNR
ncbi:MAG: hypothetical protein CVU54_13375 [Deltaproteobacteria bacterium HGW-Deltaproteobacteria-12]|nr:MAG: hypothetical protein CVU54_13375 [Deltaproteobacteria bacterium HGW-Deltaproteobacteria-12]